MRFVSTRGGTAPVPFSEAVALGLAPDGGLFVPDSLPSLAGGLGRLQALSYSDLCAEFLHLFATDVPASDLRTLAAESYASFEGPEPAPLRKIGRNTWLLELFHGPTLAFKDFALQLLGNLYARQCRIRGETINVLGATSGDTGAAAIHGLVGRPGTAIFILYPKGRISPLQERQMACTGSPTVFALAVDGTFDDCQAALKAVFSDSVFREERHLSAVNSINVARILAQCVYYLHAWLRLPPDIRPAVEFAVPTGNFGNVLAGWMLGLMGVPVGSFRVATNQNDLLYRFFTAGEYRPEPVRPSLAPSMDIQAASNFERYRYYTGSGAVAGNAEAGRVGPSISASRCTDEEIPSTIRRVYERFGVVVDPHTACAFKDLDEGRPTVVLATAHPAKFPETIGAAIGIEPVHPGLEALKNRPIIRTAIAADPGVIKKFIAANGL